MLAQAAWLARKGVIGMTPFFTDYEVNEAGEHVLPTYCGYTVDIAERAFYRVENDDFDYISFASSEGELMVFELLAMLPRDSRLYQKLSELNRTQDYVQDPRMEIIQ